MKSEASADELAGVPMKYLWFGIILVKYGQFPKMVSGIIRLLVIC